MKMVQEFFYFDDVQIKEVESKDKNVTTIGYESKTDGFPNTVPAIQNFEQKEGVFKLTKRNQIFSTDKFSKYKVISGTVNERKGNH